MVTYVTAFTIYITFLFYVSFGYIRWTMAKDDGWGPRMRLLITSVWPIEMVFVIIPGMIWMLAKHVGKFLWTIWTNKEWDYE